MRVRTLLASRMDSVLTETPPDGSMAGRLVCGPADVVVLGNVGPSGVAVPYRGTYTALARAKTLHGIRYALVPKSDEFDETELPEGSPQVIRYADVMDAYSILGTLEIMGTVTRPSPHPGPSVCISDIRGQEHAIRGAMIAAVLGTSLRIEGSPGCGRTMLARRVPGLLPALEGERLHEKRAIFSTTIGSRALDGTPPFRAPHHSCNGRALRGGRQGTATTRAGEVSLAHGGVLFLDEVFEFRRDAIEGVIAAHRSKVSEGYPADFMLVTSSNPCPCGYRGHPRHACDCPDKSVEAYRARVPMLTAPFGRAEVVVTMNSLDPGIKPAKSRMTSDKGRALVIKARIEFESYSSSFKEAPVHGRVALAIVALRFAPSLMKASILANEYLNEEDRVTV